MKYRRKNARLIALVNAYIKYSIKRVCVPHTCAREKVAREGRSKETGRKIIDTHYCHFNCRTYTRLKWRLLLLPDNPSGPVNFSAERLAQRDGWDRTLSSRENADAAEIQPRLGFIIRERRARAVIFHRYRRERCALTLPHSASVDTAVRTRKLQFRATFASSRRY